MNNLALGTAQFGLDYGIANQNGRVDLNSAIDILELAKNNHIDTLDTSINYGNSEIFLGGIGVDGFNVVTKTLKFKDNIDYVVDGFHKSMESLNRKNIYGLLIHSMEDVTKRNFNELFKCLNNLKKKKMINKIGFSTYTPEDVDFLLENFQFDLIQVPLNVFDQRLIEGGQLERLKNKNIEIHARSAFLQGVLLNLDNLPNYFLKWKDHFDYFQNSLQGFSPLEASLGFLMNIDVDKIVVGVDNKAQLVEIINASNKIINLNFKNFSTNDTLLINPTNWEI
jgi:aryl-alcohol dehydrogenase-like predicted oxidoreductase